MAAVAVRVGIKAIVAGSLRKLSKATLDKLKIIAINQGKQAAVGRLTTIIVNKTGLDRQIAVRVATFIMNKIVKEIKKKI